MLAALLALTVATPDFSVLPGNWEQLHHETGFYVDITVLVAAVLASIKFGLYRPFAHRFITRVSCKHWADTDGSVLICVDYIIRNLGKRPLKIRKVTVEVIPAEFRTNTFEPLVKEPLKRVTKPDDPTQAKMLSVRESERVIISLNYRMDRPQNPVFIRCEAFFSSGKIPDTSWLDLYNFKAASRTERSTPEGTKAPPTSPPAGEKAPPTIKEIIVGA